MKVILEASGDVESFSSGSRRGGAGGERVFCGRFAGPRPVTLRERVILPEPTLPQARRGRRSGHRGRRGARSGRRPTRGRLPRPAHARRLSKSATKAPIEPERARRNVDIPRFSSRPIPARSAFVADLDTPPPRVATGAPPAPRRHPQITFMASELIRTADVEVGVSGPRPPRRRTQGLLLRARHRGGRPRARARAGPPDGTYFRRYSAVPVEPRIGFEPMTCCLQDSRSITL